MAEPMHLTSSEDRRPSWHATTIVTIRKGGEVVIAGDGQVSLGQTIIKANARKVRRLGKGTDRPMNGLEDRLAVMAALEAVSLVTWFDEDTPLTRILECRPEVLVKGGDWAPERIVGAQQVLEWGGAVHSIPFAHARSTTSLIERIRTGG